MRIAFPLLVFLFAGCVGTDQVLDLTFESESAADGELILPAGSPQLVRVTAKNRSGTDVSLNPFDVRWSSSDAVLTTLEPYGTDCWVTTTKDRLEADLAENSEVDPDAPEPSADLVVAYGENEAQIVARSVIDASGDWSIVLDPGTKFEVWLDISIEQTGRMIRATPLLMSGEGEVSGRTIIIVSDGNVLRGGFFRTDDRLRVQGTIVYDSGNNGQWSAIRKE